MALTLQQKEMLAEVQKLTDAADHCLSSMDNLRDEGMIIDLPTYRLLELVHQINLNEFERAVYVKKFLESEERRKRLRIGLTAIRNLQKRVDARIVHHDLDDVGWDAAIRHLGAYSRLRWLQDDEEIKIDTQRMCDEARSGRLKHK